MQPLEPSSNASPCLVVPSTRTFWKLRNNLKVTRFYFFSSDMVLLRLSSLGVNFIILRFLVLLDRKPGEVETITDLLMENWKNFPEARQLGEDSACISYVKKWSPPGGRSTSLFLVRMRLSAGSWEWVLVFILFGTKGSFSPYKIPSRFLHQLP